jgi:hypothetical protein
VHAANRLIIVLGFPAAAAACGSPDDSLFGRASEGGGGASTETTATTSTTSATATATSSGAGGDGGDCEASLFYCDGDGDNHGDIAVTVEACEAPGPSPQCAGYYVPSSDDCAPNDPVAHPGQAGYFDSPAVPPVHGEAFDYDCDGALQKDASQLFLGTGEVACGNLDCNQGAPRGFAADAACGQTGHYFACEWSWQSFSCAAAAKEAPEPLRCR